jgi:hypothetical protein
MRYGLWQYKKLDRSYTIRKEPVTKAEVSMEKNNIVKIKTLKLFVWVILLLLTLSASAETSTLIQYSVLAEQDIRI